MKRSVFGKGVSWDNISESTRILKSYMSYCKQKRNGTRLQANPLKNLVYFGTPYSRWVDVWLDNDDVATDLVKNLSNIIHLIYWGVTKDAFVPLKEISSMGRRNSSQWFVLNLTPNGLGSLHLETPFFLGLAILPGI